MCGQSVSLWKLEVAVLTADKVEGGCLNANAYQRSQQLLSSMESRDEAQKASRGVWYKKKGKNFRWCCLFQHIFRLLFDLFMSACNIQAYCMLRCSGERSTQMFYSRKSSNTTV